MNPHPALPRKRGREMERMWLLLGASLVLGGCSLDDVYCLFCEEKTRAQLEREDYDCRFEAEHGGRNAERCKYIERQPCKDC